MDNEFKCVTPFTKDTIITDADQDTSYLGFIEGYAATSFKDRYGEIISDKALKKGVKDLLANPTVFKNHEYNIEDAVGRVLEAKFVKSEDLRGIKVKVAISKTATELWTKVKEGIVRAFSIGGLWKDVEYDEDLDADVIGDIDIWELSVVGLPANNTALLGALAVKHIESIKSKEETTEDIIEEVSEEEDKQEDLEKIKMTDDLELMRKNILEMEEKLASLSKIEKSQESTSDSITKIAESVTVLADSIKPLLEDRKSHSELAERKSAIIAEKREYVSQLPYRKQLTLDMRNIVNAIRDKDVEEVVLLGSMEPEPSFYGRTKEDLIEEERRIMI